MFSLVVILIASLSCFPVGFSQTDSNETVPSTDDPLIESSLSRVCEEGDVCARKCCLDGQVMNFITRACQPLKNVVEDWQLGLSLIYGMPPNPSDEKCFPRDIPKVKLLDDGTLFYNQREISYTTDYYCMDTFIAGNKSSVRAILCLEPIMSSNFENHMKKVKLITLTISCIVLLILIAAHILNPEMRQKTSEKCFLSMCIAIFCQYFALIFINVKMVQHYHSVVCVLLAILVQYFSLAFNFWLNVRCFETLRIVRLTVKLIPISRLRNSESLWRYYSFFAWGIPLIISAYTIIMQVLPEEMLLNYQPQIGKGRCWFIANIWVLAIYYYAYQVILHGLNVIYLGISFCMLYRLGEMRCCSTFKEDENKIRSHNKKSLNMFWQQFYIFLLIVVILSLDTVTLSHPRARSWQIVDISNTLLGVGLAVIFLMSSKSRRNLMTAAYNSSSSLAESIATKFSNLQFRSRSSPNSNSTSTTAIMQTVQPEPPVTYVSDTQ